MRRRLLLAVSVSSFLLGGCLKDDADKFVGFWGLPKDVDILEIKRVDDKNFEFSYAYLLRNLGWRVRTGSLKYDGAGGLIYHADFGVHRLIVTSDGRLVGPPAGTMIRLSIEEVDRRRKLRQTHPDAGRLKF